MEEWSNAGKTRARIQTEEGIMIYFFPIIGSGRTGEETWKATQKSRKNSETKRRTRA